MKSTHTCGSLLRAYMGGNACIAWFNATNEPHSLISQAAAIPAGLMFIWLLMVAGVALLVDVVINDILPERFHWRVAVRHRHLILSTMAFCYIAQLYVAFYSLRSTGLLIFCLWNAATLMFIAMVDAHQRSKDATCQAICN